MVGGLVAALPLLLAGVARAHVSLLWPPARGTPGLDFIDTFRTPGDCGADPGSSRTELRAGADINVTWHLGYPHRGGVKIQLISPSQGLSMQLLPATGGAAAWSTDRGRTAQSHTISLPQVECDDCYLKLERQSLEWGKNYRFRSCADVSVRADGPVTTCGPGTRQGTGACVCPPGRVGDRCQYNTECKSDNDCNGPKGQGQCVVTDTAVYTIGHCYCAAGWHGVQCEAASEPRARDYSEADYTAQQLDADGKVKLLWRRLPADPAMVELIMSGPTTSWLGLGWRPADATAACRKFPNTLPAPIASDFHAMDCADMVIGSARAGRGRVGDYYTRDRSTPMLDSEYGGEDDLESAHAWEEDGVTTVRAVRGAGGVADHTLSGRMQVIWAVGQDTGFYGADQLKYHGGGSQRGVTVIDFGVVESGGFSPLQIALGISCALLLLLAALQVAQNLDKKLSCLNPATYRSFN